MYLYFWGLVWPHVDAAWYRRFAKRGWRRGLCDGGREVIWAVIIEINTQSHPQTHHVSQSATVFFCCFIFFFIFLFLFLLEFLSGVSCKLLRWLKADSWFALLLIGNVLSELQHIQRQSSTSCFSPKINSYIHQYSPPSLPKRGANFCISGENYFQRCVVFFKSHLCLAQFVFIFITFALQKERRSRNRGDRKRGR